LRPVAESSIPLDEPRAAVKNHLVALTGLRIVPALAVYLYHVHAPAGSPDWLARAFGLGYGGVTVFFVLSGFVLSINYWDALSRPSLRALRGYAAARVARIYPLYILVILYIYLHTHVPTGRPMPGLPWHLVGLQAWLPSTLEVWAYGPPWSVSVELFLYACLPLVVFALRPLRRTRSLLIAMFATAFGLLAMTWWFQHTGRAALPWTDTGSDHFWLYRNPLTRIFDLMLGILGARLYVAVRNNGRAGQLGAALAAVAAVAFALLLTQTWVWGTAYRWDAAWALPGIVLIVGLALAPRCVLSRVLAIPIIVLLGEASYAFYLIHISVRATFGAGSWTVAFTPSRVLLEMMALGLTLVLSIGLHLMIERPARVKVRGWLGGRARTPVPAGETLRPAPNVVSAD
jgi:peptidoglycan/LPS O-acetylase OafA/YrhL